MTEANKLAEAIEKAQTEVSKDDLKELAHKPINYAEVKVNSDRQVKRLEECKFKSKN